MAQKAGKRIKLPVRNKTPVPAKYKCTGCTLEFQLAHDDPKNPRCPRCGYVYVEWLNYPEYIAQWD